MKEYGLLRCPVREELRLCPVTQFNEPEELKEIASKHLKSHRLIESKHGIFRVKMVRERDRIEIENSSDVSTRQWTADPGPISV